MVRSKNKSRAQEREIGLILIFGLRSDHLSDSRLLSTAACPDFCLLPGAS